MSKCSQWPYGLFWGNQGRNLQAETEAESIEEWGFMAYFPSLFSRLSYTVQVHLLRPGTTNKGLSSLASNEHLIKSPTNMTSQANLTQVIPQLKFPLSEWLRFVRIKLTEINQHNIYSMVNFLNYTYYMFNEVLIYSRITWSVKYLGAVRW